MSDGWVMSWFLLLPMRRSCSLPTGARPLPLLPSEPAKPPCRNVANAPFGVGVDRLTAAIDVERRLWHRPVFRPRAAVHRRALGAGSFVVCGLPFAPVNRVA